MLNAKYFVKYNGEIITLKQFAKKVGVRYNTLQYRAIKGEDLFSPISQYSEEESVPRRLPTATGGYTLDELAELYTKFRGTEDELKVLADLACISRRGKVVNALRQRIIEYLEQKQKEVQGK